MSSRQRIAKAMIAAVARACRICGCTDADACVDLFGDPCHWIESDLCSACAYTPATEDDGRPAAFNGVGATGFVRGHS